MPASLADGGPVVFCPTGLPDSLNSKTHHHHHDGDDGKAEELAWEHCAYGATFDSEALLVSDLQQLPVFGNDTAGIWQQSLIVSAIPPTFRSRAPPLLDS